MKELGLKPAPWVEQMLASRPRELLRGGRDEGHRLGHPGEEAGDGPGEPADPTRRAPPPRRTSAWTATTARTLWDMGDGALLLEFHSKMNSIDDDIVEMMNRALDRAERTSAGLVIGNDGSNFSAGANIMALLMAIKSDDLGSVREDGRRLPGREPAHALQPDPGGGRAVRPHPGRRRRGDHGRQRHPGRGRALHGPGRGGRGPHPRRRRQPPAAPQPLRPVRHRP